VHTPQCRGSTGHCAQLASAAPAKLGLDFAVVVIGKRCAEICLERGMHRAVGYPEKAFGQFGMPDVQPQLP